MKNYRYCYLAALGLSLAACRTDKDLVPAVEPGVCAGPSASAAGRVRLQVYENLGPAGPTLTLLSQDEMQYSCVNYALKQRFSAAGQQLTLDFLGAEAPNICLTSIGPARGQTDISALPTGTYNLALSAAGRATTGTLTLLADRVELSVCDSNTVLVRQAVTRRIPATTVWGTAYARTPAAQQAVAGVLDSLRRAGAQPLTLPQGTYSYFRTDANGQLALATDGLSGLPTTVVATPILLSYSGNFAVLKGIVKRRAQATDLSFTIQSTRGELAF